MLSSRMDAWKFHLLLIAPVFRLEARGITRASLEEKWQAKVDGLGRAGTPVAAPEAALSGAILIR